MNTNIPIGYGEVCMERRVAAFMLPSVSSLQVPPHCLVRIIKIACDWSDYVRCTTRQASGDTRASVQQTVSTNSQSLFPPVLTREPLLALADFLSKCFRNYVE